MSFDKLRMSGWPRLVAFDKLRLSGSGTLNLNSKSAQAELVEARAQTVVLDL